jgi:hypothetical protein
MPLRLAAEGAKVVDAWRAQRCRSPEDERLVAEVLRTVAGSSWQLRWYSYKNESEPDITTIQPREGLYVHVRLWTGDDEDEFTIVAITDIDAPEDDT